MRFGEGGERTVETRAAMKTPRLPKTERTTTGPRRLEARPRLIVRSPDRQHSARRGAPTSPVVITGRKVQSGVSGTILL
jgi:hypothetical protein